MRSHIKLLFVSLIAFVFTIIKGFRLPNDWAEAHWMIGYQFGFIKRGLPGAMLELFSQGGDDLEKRITAIAIFIFVVFCGLLILVIYNVLSKGSAVEDFVVLIIFFTSGYIVMSAHLMGYYDHIVIILLVVSIILVDRGYLITASLILGMSILVHETTLLISLPLCSFHLMVKSSDKVDKSLAKLLILPVTSFVFVFVLNTTQPIPASVLQDYLENYSFIEGQRHEMVADAFTQSFISYLRSQIVQFPSRVLNLQFVIKIGIPVACIAFICWKKMGSITRTKKSHFSLYILCILLPLSLHAIAWDTARIWSYSLIIASFGYFSLKLNGLMSADYKNFGLILIFSLCVAINLIPKLTLMDQVSERFNLVVRISSLFILIILALVSAPELKSIFLRTFRKAPPS